MCGIIGIAGDGPVAARLLDGLKRLEYRGYDSTGIATLWNNNIERRRASGKLHNLASLINEEPISGAVGIGHTRWATHGAATTENAHPHASNDVVLVHNGIIENCHELKEELIQKGHTFSSDTDSEVIVHLITEFLKTEPDPLTAVQKTVQRLQGAYALAILFRNHPNIMIGVRHGSPLVVGATDREIFLGSDSLALAPWTRNMIYMEDGDIVVGNKQGDVCEIRIYDKSNIEVERPVKISSISADQVTKGEYSHFMLKEIFEQPESCSETLQYFIKENVINPILPWEDVKRIRIIACGTSFYAGMIGKYWFEQIAKIPCEVEIASEFRYRSPVIEKDCLYLFISQSGETIDTFEALTLVSLAGAKTACIVNVIESSIARHADYVLQTQAGPEIGVASTKAFTAQLLVLLIAAMSAAQQRKIDEVNLSYLLHDLMSLPRVIQEVLQKDQQIYQLTQSIINAQTVLYLGRGMQYPLALEGALKLKEISYIHAEGYPAGELKHGPIALIDNNTPVVFLIPSDNWFTKSLSNLEQVIARGAKVYCITDRMGFDQIKVKPYGDEIQSFICSDIHPLLTPIVYAVPTQLFAYYTALQKGTDVDQPRNLAKSVTVE